MLCFYYNNLFIDWAKCFTGRVSVQKVPFARLAQSGNAEFTSRK